MSQRQRTALLAATAAALVLGLYAFTLDEPGPEMDEGTLVAYPTFVIDGLVPGRDFETFYGPGEPWLVAGAFEVFQPTLGTERWVGIAFRVLIALALFALVLPFGRGAAFVAALLGPLVLLSLGAAALAIVGGLSLVLLGLALVAAGAGPPGGRPSGVWAPAMLAGGLAGGLALLFRYDLVLAATLPVVAVVVAPPRSIRWWLGGLALGIAPLIAWAAVVGPHGLDLLLGDLVRSRSGRRLPLPPLATAEGQLLWATVAATAVLLLSGVQRVRRAPWDHRGRLLLAFGVVSACLLPTALQRADIAHIGPVACVALSLLVALVPGALAAVRGAGAEARGWGSRALLGATGVTVALGGLAIAHQSWSPLRDALDLRTVTASAEVSRGGRSFVIADPAAASQISALLPRLDRLSRPGDTLFVGPRDLRRTNYADTFLYFLYPELEPGSPYTELNAGTADRDGSSLASDLERTDFLVLSRRWDRWSEPNSSREVGSAAANRVVRRDFCLRARSGDYELYQRCAPGAG